MPRRQEPMGYPRDSLLNDLAFAELAGRSVDWVRRRIRAGTLPGGIELGSAVYLVDLATFLDDLRSTRPES